MEKIFKSLPCKVETKGGTIYTAIKVSRDGKKVLLQGGGVKKWAFLSELK